MQLRVDSYPRDAAGTTTLEIRYDDPKKSDDLYIYIPSIRRIRRATTTQRCQTLAPSEFNLDDINSFNGKITDFNYKLLGEKKFWPTARKLPLTARRDTCRSMRNGKSWILMSWRSRLRTRTIAIEKAIAPQQNDFRYSLDAHLGQRATTGRNSSAFSPSNSDGREVWSVGDATIVNVQNGRRPSSLQRGL
jgi:hypothetical protein